MRSHNKAITLLPAIVLGSSLPGVTLGDVSTQQQVLDKVLDITVPQQVMNPVSVRLLSAENHQSTAFSVSLIAPVDSPKPLVRIRSQEPVSSAFLHFLVEIADRDGNSLIQEYTLEHVPQHTTYTVQLGDSLSGIAGRYHADNASTSQIMLAIYQHNPDAFIENNPNRLKSGAVLTLPASQVISSIHPADAKQFYHNLSLADFQFADMPVAQAQQDTENQYVLRTTKHWLGDLQERLLNIQHSANAPMDSMESTGISPLHRSHFSLLNPTPLSSALMPTAINAANPSTITATLHHWGTYLSPPVIASLLLLGLWGGFVRRYDHHDEASDWFTRFLAYRQAVIAGNHNDDGEMTWHPHYHFAETNLSGAIDDQDRFANILDVEPDTEQDTQQDTQQPLATSALLQEQLTCLHDIIDRLQDYQPTLQQPSST